MTLWARPRWISITTSHFEMYTDNSEKQALSALQTFEQVRYFFLKNSSRQQGPEGRVRIIAFSSEKEFKPYRPNSGAFAYYQPSHERDYIVMQDIEPEHHQTAVHEYTHLIVQHMKLDLPIWLNEGMADLYSSLEPEGKRALVGRPLPGHTMVLNSQPWMDWNVLFAVDHGSPYYNVRAKMEIFYAQSWALTHMLELGPTYSAGFQKFLATIASGTPTPEALQKVYGKSVAEVAQDVQKYVHQTTVRGAIFDVTLSKSDLDPQVADLSPFETDLALADLLSTRPETAVEAQTRLASLEQQNPNSVELEVSMGYLAWQQNHLDEARKHFRLAIDHGSKNPTLMYQYAELLQGIEGASETQENLLTQVLALQPDNLDARLLLAGTALNAHQYATSVAALSRIHTVPPAQAYRFFAISAMTRASLKDLPAAKGNAERALKYAKTSEEQMQMQTVLNYVERASNPAQVRTAPATSSDPVPSSTGSATPTPVRLNLPQAVGKTKSFECIRGGGYRLHLQVGDREMIFAMPRDPREVIVRNTGNAMTMFSCGPLKPKDLTVIYAPALSPKDDGTIAELVY